MSFTITLTPGDLDTITSGGTVTAVADGTTFELTTEHNYAGPAYSDGVCRFGLDAGRLSDLNRGIARKVWPAGIDESITVEVAS